MNFGGVDTAQFVICDSFGACDTAIVLINVIPNDPPVVIDTSGTPIDTIFATTPEDALITICPDVFDADGDAVDVTAVFGGPDNGTVTALNDGDTCFVYTPNGNYDGADTMNIVVCDTVGLCDTVVVIIDIIGLNDFPIINDDSVSTLEDTPIDIDILANDYDTADANGAIDTTSVTIVSGPFNGTATVNPNGSLNYVPDPNFTGVDTIFYVACDNGLPALILCDTAMVIINVLPVNDDPVIVDVSGTPIDTVYASGLTGTPFSVCLDAIDVDGDTLDLVSIYNGPDSGLVTGIADGDTCLIYTSNTGYVGGDTVNAVVCDMFGGCDTVVVVIDIYLNDPPFAVDDSLMVNSGATTTIDNLANDSDPNGDPFTTTAATANNGTVLINGSGTLDYTPDPGFCGTDTIFYTVCDSLGLCDSAMVFVDVNCAPIAVDDAATTDEDVAVTVDVLINDSDPDGDPITVTSASANNGSVTINMDGTLTYTPDPGFCGIDTIFYTICDIHGLCDDAIVVIDVICGNDPPIAVDDNATTGVDEPVDIDVLGNDTDPNGDIITVSSASALHGTVVLNPGGGLTYTPDPGYCGPDTITYVVCDQEPACDTGFVYITIDCPPDDIAIPQGISPGTVDGHNDLWVIQGLENYPQADVRIYNRWGNLVYNANPYNNDWAGENNQGELYGNELPVGTYFYVLELNDGSGKNYSGYVYLNR